MDKWKKCIDNNLCMYCGNKSHKVEACLLYPFGTTRFQARCAEAVPPILEAILAIQLEN